MAAFDDTDLSIDVAGNIRWTGADATPTHTVLEFIQWLMLKQDDAQAAGDDILDITVETPFDRSTDQIMTLNSPFNIDDTFATHLYDGSVSQTDPFVGGETLYSGLNIIGPVESGTQYMILQDGKILPAYWGTGINPEAAPSLVFSRQLVKTKHGGADIDGKRVVVLARELGDGYRRFPATLGTGNAVAAIGNGADIFNTTSDATIAALDVTNIAEGFQELDIDGTGATDQEYYSQWNKGTGSINQTYEYTKWISQRSHDADVTTTATGTDFVVNNATIVGQGQFFVPLTDVNEMITEVRFKVKIGSGAPTGTLYCEVMDFSSTVPTAIPDNTVNARSEDVLASAIASSSVYQEVIFRFNRFNPTTGVDQSASLSLSAAGYFITIKHDAGGAGDYFHVDGAATNVDATQNSAVENPATTWTANTNDIQLTVKSSPPVYGIPGEQMQGINIEVGYDGVGGTEVDENDIVTWGTKVTYDELEAGPFLPGEYVTFNTASDLHTGSADLSFAATANTITRSGDWEADNYVVGDYIHVSGSTNNEGRVGKVTVVTATVLTVTGVLVTENNTSATVSRMTGVVSGGRILYDDAVDEIMLSMDAQGTLLTNQIISSVRGGSLAIDTEVTALINVTIVDDDKSGGTGLLLAYDETTANDRLFLQVLSGNNPVENNIIRSADLGGDPLADFVTATATLLTKTVNPEFLGTSTGSNIIGAYGIGFETGDVGSSDRFTDLQDGPRQPPNQQSFTVTGLISGEDRVLVAPRTASLLERGQFSLNVTLNGTETVVDVTDGAETVTPIDTDIPNDGQTNGSATRLRVQLDTGVYRIVSYNSINRAGDQFSLNDLEISNSETDGDATAATGLFSSAAATFVADGVEAGDILKIAAAENDTGEYEVLSVTDENNIVVRASFNGGGTQTYEVDRDHTDWTDPNDATAGNNVFVSFIDVLANSTQESYTATVSSTRNLFVRVRDGGGTPIKTFESATAQFTSNGGSSAAVRTSDA